MWIWLCTGPCDKGSLTFHGCFLFRMNSIWILFFPSSVCCVLKVLIMSGIAFVDRGGKQKSWWKSEVGRFFLFFFFYSLLELKPCYGHIDPSSVCHLISVYACVHCDFSGGDDNTTINHIYCPIFHFQLILVEVTTCERCTSLSPMSFLLVRWHLIRFQSVHFFSRFHSLSCWFVTHSPPFQILFNKFSAS